MVAYKNQTHFCCRYDTDKREMTIGEIRETILENPRFRQLVELELRVRGVRAGSEGGVQGAIPQYATVITDGAVERFLKRYLVGGVTPQSLLIISPFIGDLEGTPYGLSAVTRKVEADGTRLLVITRKPREVYHQAGVAVLEECPLAEIRYAPDIHAKLYLAWCREETDSFALFGSGNLTESGLRHNIELGMMIQARGHGRAILRELYNWGAFTLRSKHKVVKAIRTRP
jgi:hypothetical protein